MEILKTFGFEPKLFIAQIINFVILLFVLKKILYKPILGMIKKREDTIRQGLEQAEEGRKVLEKAQIEEKNVLKKAQAQAGKITDDAKAQSIELIQRAKEEAKIDATKIIKDARDQIASETKIAEEKLTAHVSDLAVKYLEKSFSELFPESKQKELTSSVLKKIRKE